MYIQLKDDLVWRKIGNVSPNYGRLSREDKPRGGLKWMNMGISPITVNLGMDKDKAYVFPR